MTMASTSYTKTFTSYSGSDILATFGGKVVGELSAITYSVTREKAPIYTLGDPNPRSFSRGKRGIGGSLVFVVFDRDALHSLKEDESVYRHGLNTTRDYGDGNDVKAVHQLSSESSTNLINSWKKKKRPKFSDEIPPFDITINFLNEHGQSAQLTLYGVEILNEGMGMSVDDITTEKACTFIARDLDEMTPDTQGDTDSAYGM